MLIICSVTMLRTVAVFSAVTLPTPVTTIGKSCCWTLVATTGISGGGGAATVARCSICRKYTFPPPPKRTTTTTGVTSFANLHVTGGTRVAALSRSRVAGVPLSMFMSWYLARERQNEVGG